jgi:thiol:disulfide interchange protein DsbD
MNRQPSRTIVCTAVALAFAVFAFASPAHADENLFTTALTRYGWWAALPAAFLAGLLTAATPCVYPMIGITVSVFGARKETRSRAMVLSTAFVHGLAALFVPLGLFAALSGRVAGALAGHWAVQLFEAVLMFVMAANMFGLFEVSLPLSLQNRLASIGGLGVKGAFAIGFATGPIAAPCATAGLVGILDYVFRQRDVAGGAVFLYFYSLGLGLPFWLVGALSVGMPKPGVWMDRIKSVFGIVLTVMGFYYLRHLVGFFAAPPAPLPARTWFFVALVVAGLALGAVHLSLKEGTALERTRKIVGTLVAALGAVWLIAYEPPVPTITWQASLPAALERARAERRPVLVDFGAAWCVACEELLHKTFSDPSVRREATRFVSVKVDATEPTPEIDALQARYQVRGLPTVLLIDSSGREVSRVTEFVAPPRMLALMQGVN